MNYDVIVIGAGPAGVSAAVYVKSRGLNVLLLEKNKVGGIVGNVSSVTHYTAVSDDETGESFAQKMAGQLAISGVEVTLENVVSVKLAGDVKEVVTENNTYHAKSVIIANGSTPRKLEAIGAAERYGKTVGLNPFKHGSTHTGKEMYVIGGSDGAAKEAIYLSQFGKTVTIVCIEEELACIAEFKNKIAKIDNIKVLPCSVMAEIGDDVVKFKNVNTGDISEANVVEPIVFVYAGLIPNTELYGELELDNGFIAVNSKQETSISGVYAAGDICVKQVRQVATAVSDGAIAGINAVMYVG